MEDIDEIPMPNNGYFKTMEDLENFYNKYKEKYDLTQGIPIIFKHYNNSRQSKGIFLFLVKPELTMSVVFPQMLRIAIIQHKEIDEKFKEYASVKIMDKKSKSSINPDNLQYKGSTQKLYENAKDEKGFIHYLYEFSQEQEMFFQVDGFYVFPMLILAIPAVPFLMTQHLYNWTSNKIANMRNASAHHFKFKQKYTLKQRREKYEKFQEKYPGHVAIVLERHMRSVLPDLPLSHFLIEPHQNYRQLQTVLHRRIFNRKEMQEREGKVAIFFMIGGKVPDQYTSIKDISDKYKEEDGIVYMTYQEQERF